MKIYVFEDNKTTANNIAEVAKTLGDEVICESLFDSAIKLVKDIKEEDIVSLDSQLPNPEDGIRIAEAIRKLQIKCLIVWHSTVSVPDLIRLGIYPCKLPSKNWLACVVKCKAEWETKKCEYIYYKKMTNTKLNILAIRCFGYLVAHGGEGLRNKDWWHKYYQTIDEKLKAETEEGQKAFQLKSMSETNGPDWWKNIKQSDQILREIHDLQGEGSTEWKNAFTALVNDIKDEKTIDYDKVNAAYAAFSEIEQSKKAGYL